MKASCETYVPVKLMGNVVEYPFTPLTVLRVNAVLLTPGETFSYEAFAVLPLCVTVVCYRKVSGNGKAECSSLSE